MSFLQIHRDKEHKYKNRNWTWSEQEAKLKFHPHGIDSDKGTKKHAQPVDMGLKFKKSIDVAEEKIFREIFQRPMTFCDSDVVTIQDIKNVALFTMQSSVPANFVELIYGEIFDKFLHAAIFYTDFYLLVLEYLLIRRDKEAEGEVRDLHSTKVERFMSKRLSDRRLLMAREYSKILLKSDKKVTSFPTRPSAQRDLRFFELLIDFTTQCTYIAMHRRAFNAISCELNRIFRGEFFNVKRKKNCQHRFSCREQQILYGENWLKNSRKNFRFQMSPMMAEFLLSTKPVDDVMKIGEEKVLGCDKYLLQLELEFTTPECHLCLIGERCGILGHPKYLYDSMLNISEEAVRKMSWTEDYDPHGLVRRVFIKTQTADDFEDERKISRRKDPSTRLIIHREPHGGIEHQKKLWMRKEFIMNRKLRKSVSF